MSGDREGGTRPALCIVGYGSLGARELGYRSDLDLIFLYDSEDGTDDERPRTRLARKLISLLTIPTVSGKLYATDTRLRPNGRAGLLVSSISSFERYQQEHAWTWELQALTRARALDGGSDLGRRFSEIRRAVLTRPRDPDVMRHEVIDMRRRLRSEFADTDPLKHAAGGLVDMDFIAQLGVLESAPRHPRVLDSTSTTGQLRRLAEVGWIDPELAERLARQHERLARARHLAFIARIGAPAADLDRCRRLCAEALGRDAGNWFSSEAGPSRAS